MSFTIETEIQKSGAKTICVTGYEGEVNALTIPSCMDDLPVTAIGSHAFADRQTLKLVRLPETLREIRSYAFYHCRSLSELRMTDSVEAWYDGVLRMCKSPVCIRAAMQRGNFRLLKDILGDNGDPVILHLIFPDGEADLSFPEYYDEIHEDTHARAIHSTIVGAGFTYRECVTRHGIDYAEYDRTFHRVIPVSSRAAERVAMGRLLYPYHLEREAAQEYRAYLADHAEEVLVSLTEEGRTAVIRSLCEKMTMPETAVDAALEKASALRNAELCAVLMEHTGRMRGVSVEQRASEAQDVNPGRSAPSAGQEAPGMEQRDKTERSGRESDGWVL